MKHYDTAHWLQFLRSELSDAPRDAMRGHLESPCKKCQFTLELLRKVETTARAESALQVPESSVKIARSIFALHRPAHVEFGTRVRARLVFDSFREPSIAGVRSIRQVARQALYEAGEYAIDLRLEPDSDPAQVVMVGQIARREPTATPMNPSVVALIGHRREIAKTVTNSFGEFQLVYHPSAPLRLRIALPGPSYVDIAISDTPTSAKKKGSRAVGKFKPKR